MQDHHYQTLQDSKIAHTTHHQLVSILIILDVGTHFELIYKWRCLCAYMNYSHQKVSTFKYTKNVDNYRGLRDEKLKVLKIDDI